MTKVFSLKSLFFFIFIFLFNNAALSEKHLEVKKLYDLYAQDILTLDQLNSGLDKMDLNNENINIVVIATRHDSHAIQVLSSLNAGKHVFVEKPLALTLDEIEKIDKAYQNKNKTTGLKLMVGFNRRFAPHIIKMKELLSNHHSPKSILMTINAGAIPSEHWVQDSLVGGGRIIGEGCHFIDLMRNLVGHKIVDFKVTKMGNAPGVDVTQDKASITLSFADGSFGTILYLANGGSKFPL